MRKFKIKNLRVTGKHIIRPEFLLESDLIRLCNEYPRQYKKQDEDTYFSYCEYGYEWYRYDVIKEN
jgi:hypothetical protein